jgi:hypothetical protein
MDDMRDDLFPELTVTCPLCETDLVVAPGLNAADTLWMHEHDCREAIFGDLALGWREQAA